jgi:hypothetical protein
VRKQVKQGCRRAKAGKTADQRNASNQKINGKTLRSAVTWIVNEKSFQNLNFHGNTTWAVCDLIILAVLWVWSDHATLTGAFAEAHGWSLKMLGRAAVGSYQGLTGALGTVTGMLLPLLWARMHDLMERHGGEYWRVGGWLPLAVDGSRVSTPRTAPNEQAFCAANYGRSASAKQRAKQRRKNGVAQRKKKSQPVKPQIWLTLVWHMGLRLLWCWRTGPSNSSERAHFQDMLKTETFPWKTLFCGDAGFVGYDFWKSIVDQGHHFLMRVGSNVTLLKNLGYVRESHGIVYCWPSKAARKNQPPLVLRLITMKFGRTPIYLVTSVLDPNELSGETARQLYQLRWGIELQFRTLKQTFGRSKLRSKTPEHALRELDWSLLGLWMIQLFAVKEQIAIGQPPAHSSAALAIHAIRDVFHSWSEIPTKGTSLKSKLRHAVTDHYERTKESKKARYRPENKDKPHAGKPNIITATRQHKLQLKHQLALAS